MANIIIKKTICFIFKTFIKFNGTLIQLALNGDILLSQETYIKAILLVKNQKALITSLKDIIRVKLSVKKQYVVLQAKSAYFAFICQV